MTAVASGERAFQGLPLRIAPDPDRDGGWTVGHDIPPTGPMILELDRYANELMKLAIIATKRSRPVVLAKGCLLSAAVTLCARQTVLAESTTAGPPSSASVDTTTMRRKVMCGYQGWFRCPGDASGMGWIHYSRSSQRLAPDSLVFEMWASDWCLRLVGEGARRLRQGLVVPATIPTHP